MGGAASWVSVILTPVGYQQRIIEHRGGVEADVRAVTAGQSAEMIDVA